MAQRREQRRGGGWAQLRWDEDGKSFHIEQEAIGLTDENVEVWLAEVEEKLQEADAKNVICTTLNLSRNDLGDWGVRQIVRLFVRLHVSVITLKLFRNWVADEGSRAIGELIRNSPEAVQEIHLSHNQITSRGALAIFEAVQDSGKYPCNSRKGGSPLWLRMETNHIVWDQVIQKAAQWKMNWISGEKRDSWRTEQRKGERAIECPVIAMHHSFDKQASKPSKGGAKGDHSGWASGPSGKGWRGEDSGRAGDAWAAPSEGWSGKGAAASSGTAGPASGWRNQEFSSNGAVASLFKGSPPKGHGKGGESAADDSADLTMMGVQRHMEQKLNTFADQQNEKMDLILSVLNDLKLRQAKLEEVVQQIQGDHQQQQVRLQQQMAQQQQQNPQQQNPQQHQVHQNQNPSHHQGQTMHQHQPIMHQHPQHLQQPAQQYAVTPVRIAGMPVDGGASPQSWGGDQWPGGSVVW
ncbi:unnamed protein product [Polarella glacialis]|uniref:Uncharacterized protein n=1 Tax=Polarella glacialis TaxID=89957 RepID=A0A813FKJ6_POLGL|nr:unnamed protein product [Polarella glacialis]|mmetsp:Transcript_75564/g.122013  ORF Transcript_75564/g.122013 Transcript_75564/m.122013 type:complete len:465 (-) Transcript_75564:64-1458(-)